jgi:hypothetical protein
LRFHLREAKEQIESTLASIDERPEELSENDLLADFLHLYHHVNTAWHSRYLSGPEMAHQTQKEFFACRVFPIDDFSKDLEDDSDYAIEDQ